MASQAYRVGTEFVRPGRAGMSPLPSIREVGLFAQAILRDAQAGHVTAVFDSSFYAAFGGEWICIGLPHIGSGPLHVVCEGKPHGWPQLGSTLARAGSVLHLDGMPFAALQGASVWQPERAPAWTLNDLQRGLSASSELWRMEAFEDGLAAAGCAPFPAKPTPLMRAARPAVVAVDRMIAHAIDGRDVSPEDEAKLTTLIGLGPGLTPSGDDLLGGALIALASLDLLEVRDRLWSVCSECLDRTTDISGLHLRAAARGYGAAALHDAIHAAISGDVPRLPGLLAAVSDIGHSSGRDSYAGALIALRAVERHFSREQTRAWGSVEA
jgi:hypothetical protein